MRVLANNLVESEVGDVVMVENASGRVLLDAALVFLFPIVGMLTGYFATGAFPVAEEIRYIAAGIGFLLPMIGIGIYSSWKSRRQTTLSVTEILSRPTEGQESS